MKTLDPGHLYELQSLDGAEPTLLRFVKRVGERYPGNEMPEYPGTNCQEVIRALICRCAYLNGQIPCQETEAAQALLRAVLMLFETRAARIKGRAPPSDYDVEQCRRCGHLECGCEAA
jgi:hypothetical protein